MDFKDMPEQGGELDFVPQYPSSVTFRKVNLQKPYQSINTSYPIRKNWWVYLLLGKNLAIASHTKALEFRNDKCFRKVTEEGYSVSQPSEVDALSLAVPCSLKPKTLYLTTERDPIRRDSYLKYECTD